MKAYRAWNGQTHYVEAVKPALHKRGAKGDWSYTGDHKKAASLSLNEAIALLRDHPDAKLTN